MHKKCAVCGEDIPAGTTLCDNCVRCPDCGSKALTFYDFEEEGEATMECFSCGHTRSTKIVSAVHTSILLRYRRTCVSCGKLMGRFIPDNEVCLCTDCFVCPKCDEQLSIRNDKPYCWFCHDYWTPNGIHKSVSVSHGHSRKRCADQRELSFMQLDSTRNDFTLEEYYRRITEETVDGNCVDVFEALQFYENK